jgi:transcriptional regulator with XRE-family HTH domain
MSCCEMQGTNSEHAFIWRCWQEPVPAQHRSVVAHWAAGYPAALPGEALKLMRECIGLTPTELAEYIGIKPSRVTRWERTANDPMGDRAVRSLYLTHSAERTTLDDIRALLDVVQNWPAWVRLELRPHGWRATRYGDLQPDSKPVKPKASRSKRMPGLRLIKSAA